MKYSLVAASLVSSVFAQNAGLSSPSPLTTLIPPTTVETITPPTSAPVGSCEAQLSQCVGARIFCNSSYSACLQGAPTPYQTLVPPTPRPFPDTTLVPPTTRPFPDTALIPPTTRPFPDTTLIPPTTRPFPDTTLIPPTTRPFPGTTLVPPVVGPYNNTITTTTTIINGVPCTLAPAPGNNGVVFNGQTITPGAAPTTIAGQPVAYVPGTSGAAPSVQIGTTTIPAPTVAAIPPAAPGVGAGYGGAPTYGGVPAPAAPTPAKYTGAASIRTASGLVGGFAVIMAVLMA